MVPEAVGTAIVVIGGESSSKEWSPSSSITDSCLSSPSEGSEVFLSAPLQRTL